MYNVIIIFHDSDYNSGASRSMLDMLIDIKDDVNFTVVFPEVGTASVMAEKYFSRVVISKYYHLHMPIPGNCINSFVSHLKCVYKILYNRLIAIPKLKRIIDANKIDLIYCNTSVNYIGYYLKQATKKPLIWHLRESGENSGAFRMLGGWSSQANMINRYADSILVISNELKKAYSKYINPARMEVVYNDIKDIDSTSPDECKERQTKVLIAGRVCEYKNQMVAVKAISILKRKGIILGLSLAGKWDEKYKIEIDNLSHELDVYDQVEYLGQVSNISEYENTIKIMLITTRYEAFGRTAIEGMLHSMIVVSPDSGGVKELVDNGHGYIYAWNDENSLASALESAINDTDYNKRILDDAYQYALEFTQAKGAERIKKVIIEEIEKIRCHR